MMENAPMWRALDELATARVKQMSKYGNTHDDQHAVGDLARAGACYALAVYGATIAKGGLLAKLWPWPASDWRHEQTRRADLIKAASLIVAEIEKMDRLTARVKLIDNQEATL